jgi:hypothetical protein
MEADGREMAVLNCMITKPPQHTTPTWRSDIGRLRAVGPTRGSDPRHGFWRGWWCVACLSRERELVTPTGTASIHLNELPQRLLRKANPFGAPLKKQFQKNREIFKKNREAN